MKATIYSVVILGALVAIWFILGRSTQLNEQLNQASNPVSERRTYETSQCEAIIVAYRPALESVFEVELHAIKESAGYKTEWQRAYEKLPIPLLGSHGDYIDPETAVKQVVKALRDSARDIRRYIAASERRDLEYTLLGGAMPLEARRKFDQYCVDPSATSP